MLAATHLWCAQRVIHGQKGVSAQLGLMHDDGEVRKCWDDVHKVGSGPMLCVAGRCRVGHRVAIVRAPVGVL